MSDDDLLSDELFGRFSRLLHKKTGIALKEYKKYLVVNRLAQLVGPTKKFSNFEEFYQTLLTETDGTSMQAFINALTTNFSFFFRDPVHFGVMSLYLKERGQDEPYLRFWSAASSTGEEAYSMAITLAKQGIGLPPDRRILATDISTKVLALAEKGVYGTETIAQHVEPADQKRYFEAIKDENKFRVREELRANLDFRQLNLQGDYPFRKLMDIIFLRNVMIYFGAQEKAQIIEKMFAHLKPGGLLFIGLSESLAGIHHRFVTYKSSVFRKPGA